MSPSDALTSEAQPSPSAPVNGGSFAGIGDTGQFPPDPTLAAGPNNLVAATNGAVVVFRKNGSIAPGAGSNQSLSGFFSALGQPATDGPFDPKAAFDPYLNRFWLVAASEHDSTGTGDSNRSRLLIALSNTSDATEGWRLFSVNASLNGNDSTGNWCDYPQLGFDAQALYLTCNMFQFPSTTGDFQYAKVRVMTKAQFVNNACCLWYDFWDLGEGFLNLSSSFTVQPARMYGATVGDGEFLIDAHGSGGGDDVVEVWHMTHADRCCIPGNQTAPDLDQHDHDVGSFDTPPDARQPNNATAIDTGDTRFLYAFWKDGQLAAGQNLACADNHSQDGGGNACVAFTEINVSGGLGSMSTTNDWVLTGNGVDYYYPAVEVNGSGDKTMVYSRSSTSEDAGTDYIGIPSSTRCTTCSDGPETTLQAGATTYVQLEPPPTSRNRWGDYFGAAADPDGTGVWVHGEFASGVSSWGTRIGLTYETGDTSAPVTTASLNPLANGSGWNHTGVAVSLNATDAGSGVRRLTYSASGAQYVASTTVNSASVTFPISAEGVTTVSFSAEDQWGNVEVTRTLTVRIDLTPPSVACGGADSQWHAVDVSISCSAFDALSGLANPADATFTLSTNVPPGTETASASTGTHDVYDVAGNVRTAGPITGNMIDKKAPMITMTTPPAGSPYLLEQVVMANYACQDGGSGVATCSGNVANGSPIDTASVGTKTFTVNSTDNVGNASSASASYQVQYAICLLYDPSKAVPAGAVMSFRLQICDVNGVNLTSSAIAVTATAIVPNEPLTSHSNPGNMFFVNNGAYVYNLDTKGFPAGGYQLQFTVAGDPTTHSVPFQLK